ncbi:unnamed protein product [Diamesa tonsa]
MELSVFLIYFLIVVFVLYTYNNKKLKSIIKTFKEIRLKLFFKKDANQIPGPLCIPYLGTKWILWFYKMTKMHELYRDLYTKYGDIVQEVTGSGVSIIHLYNRNDIENVLKTDSKFPFRPPVEITCVYRDSRKDLYASCGIVNAQGEHWAFLRSKLTPSLQSRKALSSFYPALNDICDKFVRFIKLHRDENNVVNNFGQIANLMSLESVCCLILGRRMGYLSSSDDQGRNDEILKLASAVKTLFKTQSDSYYGLQLWKYFPTKTYKDFVKSEHTIYKIIGKILDDESEMEEMESDVDEITTIFKSILNQDMDMRDKKSSVVDFIAAGMETLSHTTSFFLYFVSLKMDFQDKIFEEVSMLNDVVTQDDVQKAVYTRAAIQESFRMSPTAFALARILEKDLILSGYPVKAGSVVLLQNMIACSLSKNGFEEPTTFNPSRWINEYGQMIPTIPNSIVQPFGCGKRICPGKKFTEMELTILVIKLIRAFKITYESPFDQQFEFILVPKGPVSIKFEDR